MQAYLHEGTIVRHGHTHAPPPHVNHVQVGSHTHTHRIHHIQVGAAIAEGEMQELFHASDIDGTGQIDYEEFIAAMLDSNRVARRKEAVRLQPYLHLYIIL